MAGFQACDLPICAFIVFSRFLLTNFFFFFLALCLFDLFEKNRRILLLWLCMLIRKGFFSPLNSYFSEDASNTLRILVATDCHLGYMEKDEIRRHDSFRAFEEICSIAEQKQVLP